MEYRDQTTTTRMILILTAVAMAQVAAAELRYDVRHERMLKDHPGVLSINETGVSYEQVLTSKQQRTQPKRKKPFPLEKAHWGFQDIQQIKVGPDKLVLVTYADRPKLLGIDKEYEFFAKPGTSFEGAYHLLKQRLDQRLVVALANESSALWEVPAKLHGTVSGVQGTLRVGADEIVFKTDRRGFSRTWRYSDVENISSSSPFQFTLTSYERAKNQYGSLKGFNFQLKERLDEKRFELLWRRLNRDRYLPFLAGITEGASN